MTQTKQPPANPGRFTDADLPGQPPPGARKTEQRDGRVAVSSNSLDPADTHHATSDVRQIKSRLIHQIVAAYRLRWQIELAFKRLKSLLHIDALPTHTEAASRSWLYAHLILALLSDELSQDFLESFP